MEALAEIQQPDGTLMSVMEYELLLKMINTFRRWIPDVSFPLSILCPFLT